MQKHAAGVGQSRGYDRERRPPEPIVVDEEFISPVGVEMSDTFLVDRECRDGKNDRNDGPAP